MDYPSFRCLINRFKHFLQINCCGFFSHVPDSLRENHPHAQVRLFFAFIRSQFSNCTFGYRHRGHIISHMRRFLQNGSSLLFRRQTNILSAAFVIMVTYGLSQVMGLIKTRLLISYFFGSKAAILDIYYAAFVIPDTLFQLLVIGSLSAAFIPVFTRYLSKSQSQAWYIASASLNLVLLAFFLLSLVIFAFAPFFSRLIAPGFNLGQISVMASLLRVMLVAQLFFTVSSFLTAIIHSHQRFLIPALAPIVYNLGIIAGTVFLSPALGIFGPAVGVVLGAFFHMALQAPLTFRLGFRPQALLDWRHPGVKETLRLMPPRALALGIDQIEMFVAVFLASLMASGSLTLLNVARLLYAIPSTLFGVTLGQAAMPTLSRLSSDSDQQAFRRTLVDTLLQAVFFALPLSILFIVLRVPIVRLVFGSRSFPWAATLTTGKTLAVLASAATFTAIMQLVVRAFYALHDTKTPLFIGLAAAAFDVTLAVVATRVFGLGVIGLALAISVTAVLETFVLFAFLSRRLHLDPPLASRLVTSLAKLGITGLITGFSLWLPMRFLDQFVFDTTRTLPLIALTFSTSIIGLIVYLFLSFLFRVNELSAFVALLQRLFSLGRQLTSPPPAEPIILPAPDQN
ncbi:MAG: hypothetical protein UX78_C0002G0062 [Candidatus Amesbacteria bacterium GW2011_GWA2_47_11]|uniref:Probable lipid II flippase MurJ n=3 Tax=Candidatus Amesiibacteriota TaxID=1752730 RepID=A0A0G1RII1_9BACT|nr:MAG: hypothetical protein UX78_C0002G0062 [Candidatus Amesbacteria bacterium GW2011_GWA2_47_11]